MNKQQILDHLRSLGAGRLADIVSQGLPDDYDKPAPAFDAEPLPKGFESEAPAKKKAK